MFSQKNLFVLTLLCLPLLFISCSSSKKSTEISTIRSPLKPKELKHKYAAILHVKPNKIKNKKLYYFIDVWNGVNYKYGGNGKEGIDCSAFTKQLYNNVYNLSISRTVKQQKEASKSIRKKKKLKEGDLVFFRSGENHIASHAGVYLKNGYFVHSATTKGVMISNLKDTYWDKNFICGGKLKQ